MGMIHAEQGLDAGILELIVEFGRRVEGIAGNADRAGFENAEIDLRVLWQVGQENGHPIALGDAPGMQKIGDAVGRFLYLGIGAGGVVENRVGCVRVAGGGIVQHREQWFVVIAEGVWNTFGPVGCGPSSRNHRMSSRGSVNEAAAA